MEITSNHRATPLTINDIERRLIGYTGFLFARCAARPALPQNFSFLNITAHRRTAYGLFLLKLNWFDAADFCHSRINGAHLVVIRSLEEQRAVAYFIGSQ